MEFLRFSRMGCEVKSPTKAVNICIRTATSYLHYWIVSMLRSEHYTRSADSQVPKPEISVQHCNVSLDSKESSKRENFTRDLHILARQTENSKDL
jgi:hypothetical protein